MELVTSWFSDALITANGQGYFAVEISRNLKPYLLKVKREFFKFRLQQVMQMRSAYAIRLYQFAKRWEFKRKYLVSVTELRGIMGALHPAGRGKTKAALGNYADFKRRAVQTAVDEINAKSDIFLSFVEIKARGSKAVESLDFTIAPRADRAGIETSGAARDSADGTGTGAGRGRHRRRPGESGPSKRGTRLSEKQAENVRGYYRAQGCGVRGRENRRGRLSRNVPTSPSRSWPRCATIGSPPAVRRRGTSGQAEGRTGRTGRNVRKVRGHEVRCSRKAEPV